MRNILKILSIILFVPAFSLAQNDKPENFKGTLIIEHKPVEFNYLSTPDGTTEIPYFKKIPSKYEYLSNLGQEFLPLKKVKDIKMVRFSAEELQDLYDSCEDCLLYKADITFYEDSGSNVETLYLTAKYFTWKNTDLKDYCEPHIAELRFLEAVIINKEIE